MALSQRTDRMPIEDPTRSSASSNSRKPVLPATPLQPRTKPSQHATPPPRTAGRPQPPSPSAPRRPLGAALRPATNMQPMQKTAVTNNMSWSAIASSGPSTAQAPRKSQATIVGTPTRGGPAQNLCSQMADLRVNTAASNRYDPQRAPPQKAPQIFNPGKSGPARGPYPGGMYDPSAGPAATMASTKSTNWRAQSHASNGPTRYVVDTKVCKYYPNRTGKDFRKGAVISLPYHQSNTNPNLDVERDRDNLTITKEYGAVFSKRRMMVVLYVYQEDMFCLPLFSWNGKGINNRPDKLRREYVGMTNATDGEDYVNHAIYDPVVIEGNNFPMKPETTVVLTQGQRVACIEDIRSVGRLTATSYTHLLALWKDLSEQAQTAPWGA
ncbi:hypothetical protein LTR17_003041 [Elasticomyces elasticus]|nr:hypothetical protein LTR17_003041 [Elasticomyces elasticus]